MVWMSFKFGDDFGFSGHNSEWWDNLTTLYLESFSVPRILVVDLPSEGSLTGIVS